MSIFLDTKYLLLISNRFPLFKKKTSTTYNCRCVFCGDSQKSYKKARGYFFPYKTDLRYKCHNCNLSVSLGHILQQLDPNLYTQYAFERYTEGQQPVAAPPFLFDPPKFLSTPDRWLHSLLRVSDLPVEHEAVAYCQKRKIPQAKLKLIFYIDNIKKIVCLNEKYKNSILTEEPRLVFPFYNEKKQLTGVTCRAIRGESLRYITIKVLEQDSLIYGLQDIDYTKPIYVVEGPIDSLFLNNSIAVAGMSFNKVESLLNINNLIYIFDNQPRSLEVCNAIEKHIQRNVSVVIWPQTIREKDINDMVLSGLDVNKIVNNNIFNGLEARMKLVSWKRI